MRIKKHITYPSTPPVCSFVSHILVLMSHILVLMHLLGCMAFTRMTSSAYQKWSLYMVFARTASSAYQKWPFYISKHYHCFLRRALN